MITSAANEKIQLLASLHNAKGRKESGLFLIEGEHLVQDALHAGAQIAFALADETCFDRWECQELLQGRLFLASRQTLKKAADTLTPQGILAAVHIKPEKCPYRFPLVILDGLQDPGNCGTIWRTCEATGFGGIVFGGNSADPYSPKVVRASMGAVFRLPAYRAADTAAFVAGLSDTAIVVSELEGTDFFRRDPIVKPYALVIGSEGQGVSQEVRRLATVRLRLPMAGKTESLNACVAAGIMMYDFFRKEGGAEP